MSNISFLLISDRLSSLDERCVRLRRGRALFLRSSLVKVCPLQQHQRSESESLIMTDYLSVLPTELLEVIFAHLSMSDLLASVCYVNKRLRSVSLAHRRFVFDFDSFAKKNGEFQSVCSYLPLISSELVSLTISNEYDRLMSLKIRRFVSRFLTIDDSFSKLNSITLSSIDCQLWRSINRRLTTLPSLVSLSLRCTEKLDLSIASALLCELRFDSPSLKRLQVKMHVEDSDGLMIDPRPEPRISQIEDLSLQGIRVELKSLFAVAPALQSVNVPLRLFQFRPDTRFHSPENLRHLTISVNFIELHEIEVMLHSLKQLTHLTVISNNVQYDMANGWIWSDLLKSISVFKFHFTFGQSTFTSPPIDLTSFRTPFWLKEKRWFVTCERSIETGFSLLYSDPYSLSEDSLFFMRNSLIIDSTAPQVTVLPAQTNLMADHPYPIELVLQLRVAYPERTRNSLADCGSTLRAKVDFALEHLHLSQIRSFSAVQCETDLATDVFVKFLQHLPRLRTLRLSLSLLKRLLTCEWPQILQLDLSVPGDPFTSDEIEPFCRSFPHLDRLGMSIDVLSDLSPLLKHRTKMSTLSHIWISSPGRDRSGNDEQVIDRQWFETNTQLRRFHYYRDEHGTCYFWL